MSASPEPTSAPNLPSSPPSPPAGGKLRQDRNALLAVTVFPIVILAAAFAGFFFPGTFSKLTPAISPLLGVIMFLMGVTLTFADFRRLARRPWVVLLGLVAHYVVMPLTGWFIAVPLLHLPAALAVGVILVGCAPSGTSSNVMTYLAKGDVAFAVSVATVSTLLAPIVMPGLMMLLAGQLVNVPFSAMFGDISKTVLIPVVLGFIVRALFGKIIDLITPVLPWISSLAMAVIIATVMGNSAAVFLKVGAIIILAVVLHNVIGLTLGYLIGRAARLNVQQRRALTFECGMQNSGLAASIATTSMSPMAALGPAIFSVWLLISGAGLAAGFARKGLPAEEADPTGSTKDRQLAAAE